MAGYTKTAARDMEVHTVIRIVVSLCASGLLLIVPALASTQKPGQGAVVAPPPQKYGEHHELRILRVRTAKDWTMFPSGPPQFTPSAGEVLLIVEYAVKDLRTGKDDTSSFDIEHFSGLELQDGSGNTYKSPLERANLKEIPFSVPDPAAIRVFRISGHPFDIQSMTNRDAADPLLRRAQQDPQEERMALMASALVIVAATAYASAPAQGSGMTKVTAVTTHAEPLKFSAPEIGLSGEISPGPGRRLFSVEVTFGARVTGGDIAAYKLVSSPGQEHSPIGAGLKHPLTKSNQILPLDKLRVGTVLIVGSATDSSPESATVLRRRTQEAITIDSPVTGVIVLLYEIPLDASPTAVKMPDGSLLSMKK